MIINGQMVILAREFRGMTQTELARKIHVSQATVARIEAEFETDVEELRVQTLTSALSVTEAFLQNSDHLIGVGSSAYFYRKKAKLSAADMKRIHAVVNLLRMHLKKMLDSVEIEPARKLPNLPIDDFSGSAKSVAQALRQMWNVPDGPIRNLTHLIESAGVIVIPCDFGTEHMDGTSIRLAELPPIVFMNANVPGDRWRFTLAHELCHLVAHDVPSETMEDEADEFASEFLMPALNMKAVFSRMERIRIADLANIKPYWKTSIGSLIQCAKSLGVIDRDKQKSLWIQLRKHGYPEPSPIEREEPKNFRNMLNYFMDNLEFSPEELARHFAITRQDLELLHGPSSPKIRRRHLFSV